MQNIDERKQIINEMIYEDEVFISKMDRLDERGKEFLDNICREADKIAEQTLKLDDDEAYKYMAEQIKRAKKNIVKMLRKRSRGVTPIKKPVDDDSDKIPEEEPSVLTSDEPEEEVDEDYNTDTVEHTEVQPEPEPEYTEPPDNNYQYQSEQDQEVQEDQPEVSKYEKEQDHQFNEKSHVENNQVENNQKHGKFYNKNKYHQYKKSNHHSSNSNYNHNDNRY